MKSKWGILWWMMLLVAFILVPGAHRPIFDHTVDVFTGCVMTWRLLDEYGKLR